jgi:hypothetical protein
MQKNKKIKSKIVKIENPDGVRRQVVIPLFSQGQALRKQESRGSV